MCESSYVEVEVGVRPAVVIQALENVSETVPEGHLEGNAQSKSLYAMEFYSPMFQGKQRHSQRRETH